MMYCRGRSEYFLIVAISLSDSFSKPVLTSSKPCLPACSVMFAPSPTIM